MSWPVDDKLATDDTVYGHWLRVETSNRVKLAEFKIREFVKKKVLTRL